MGWEKEEIGWRWEEVSRLGTKFVPDLFTSLTTPIENFDEEVQRYVCPFDSFRR